MSIRWEGPYSDASITADGFDPDGGVAVRIVRYPSGWHAFLRGDPIPDRVHATADEAKAAAEAAWKLAPEPPQRRRGDRRLVGNVEGEAPPHPSTLRRPPS
jgi:hypothetical protein